MHCKISGEWGEDNDYYVHIVGTKHLPSRWQTRSAYQQYKQASAESHGHYLDLLVLTVPTDPLQMFAYATWFVLFDSLPYQHKFPLIWH